MEVESQYSSPVSNRRAVPATLRIGVTGHRILPDTNHITEGVLKINKQLDLWLCRKLPNTPHTYTVISPLAEGADRLVARKILDWKPSTGTREPRLEAVFPLPEEDYIRDFGTQASKDDFRELFQRKASLRILGSTADRNKAYEAAGRYVVDNCDVLIAVWNGRESQGRGGTAEIVSYAKKAGRHILWINPENPKVVTEIRPRREGKRYIESLRLLERFNAESKSTAKIEKAVEDMVSTLAGKTKDPGMLEGFLPQARDQVLPWFVQADLLAQRYQGFHNIAGAAIYWMSALAVVMVAIYVLFFPAYPKLLLAEVAPIAMIIVLLIVSHWLRWQRKWIDYRFLAERLRATIFLKAAAMKCDRPEPPPYLRPSHRPDDWMITAFGWIWDSVTIDPIHSADALKTFLGEAWINDQANYYRATQVRLRSRHSRYFILGYALFSLTLLVAVVHFAEILRSISHVLAFMAIALPAIGAALHGIRAQRDYHRNAERYRAMADHLTAIGGQVAEVKDMKTLVQLLNDANEMMLREHQNWRVVVLFHKLEPPA